MGRAAAGRRDERHFQRIVRIARQNIAEQFTGADCLALADVVERNVLIALKAARRIPFGLAVTDVIDNGLGHEMIFLAFLPSS